MEDMSMDDEDVYEVEQIVGISKEEGTELYKVRWKGYAPTWDTWEPIENLQACLDMIVDFKTKNPNYIYESMDETNNEEGSSKAKTGTEDPSSSSDRETTVKDTFWDDLQDGKINVFESDMYSKLKTSGRAARPSSFTDMYSSPRAARADDDDVKPKDGESLKNKKKKVRKDSDPGKKTDISAEKNNNALKVKKARSSVIIISSDEESDTGKCFDNKSKKSDQDGKSHRKSTDKEKKKKHHSKDKSSKEYIKKKKDKVKLIDIGKDTNEPTDINDKFKKAVKSGNYQVVSQVLAHNSADLDLEQPEATKMTLVMIAALNGYEDILELLLLHGANINTQQVNTGNTALMYASEHNHVCTVAVLLDKAGHMNVQNSAGDTALIKAVKKGHTSIVKLLLEHGANVACETQTGNTALTFTQILNNIEIQNIIEKHASRILTVYEEQVHITLNNTAKIMCTLFPVQCLSLCEGDTFLINFKHDLQATIPGLGMLLFIAHARVTAQEVRCRFYGPCAITSVVLNGVPQPALTEEGNFVMSFSPLHNGLNELIIHTVAAPQSKAKLVVCAYKAKLST